MNDALDDLEQLAATHGLFLNKQAAQDVLDSYGISFARKMIVQKAQSEKHKGYTKEGYEFLSKIVAAAISRGETSEEAARIAKQTYDLIFPFN